MYSEGSNYIKALPLKSRTKQSYLQAHKDGLEYFGERGYMPTFQRLDNEVSNEFSTHLAKHNIQIDLAPPHQHRRNKAERAIRTWKNHFIAALAGVDPQFPMCAWNELLTHIEITLNLMRGSPTHPRMSAWEGLNGPYDFDAHPLAPPGIAITIHEKPDQRNSWSKHGVKGFYIGPALKHYRCYSVWAESSSSVRTTDTVAWHPKGYAWAQYSPLDVVTEISDALATALHHLANSESNTAAHQQPLQHVAHDLITNFRALRDIYTLPPTPPTEVTCIDDNRHQQRVVEATDPTQSTEPPPAIDTNNSADNTTKQRVPETSTSVDTIPTEQRVPAPGLEPIVPDATTTSVCVDEMRTACDNPPSTAPLRHSSRCKHRWLNRTNAAIWRNKVMVREARLPYDARQAIAIAERAGSKKTRNRRHHPPETQVWEEPSQPTPAHLKHINRTIYHAKRLLANMEWKQWANSPAVAFDSKGTPFLCATTAVDLDDQGRKLNMTSALNSKEGHIWLAKHGEEIIRLFDSGTVELIHWNQIPADKRPAYYNPQVKTKIKDGQLQYRVRGTIGGNQIHYAGETAAHTASMQLIKILLNSVVSEKGAKFMTADIKDFYLGTPLPNAEYMRINLDHIPSEVIDKYGMQQYAHNGAVVVQVNKGIYGLPQAGILAQDRLVAHLASHGYHQAPHTPCLFKHVSNSIAFTLVVDDFGIKYTQDADADHLLKVLRELYIMTEDRAAKQKYVGITIEHDRTHNTIHLTMPGYIDKAIQRFGRAKHPGAKSPITYTPPQRGKAQQMVPDPPAGAHEFVDQTTKTYVQEVTGVLLFYSRAVDPTMLIAVNKISSDQSKPTKATLDAVDRLLSYAERYPNATIVLRPSNMQLQVQSDASYHSETNARSRAGGILYFGINNDGSINGAIDHISCIIPTVCSSVAEAEYAALFLVGREATNARNILDDLGYPQHTTTIICDNACAVGLANDTVKQKRSKAIDMRYHWIRDQVSQHKFKIKWEEGATNLADYFTKAHPVHHYVNMRRTYVFTPKSLVIKQCARSRRIQRRINNAIASARTGSDCAGSLSQGCEDYPAICR
jgi:hypothetical protein